MGWRDIYSDAGNTQSHGILVQDNEKYISLHLDVLQVLETEWVGVGLLSTVVCDPLWLVLLG